MAETTTYTVKKGDTLSEIAAKYNTTVSNIVDWNDIKNPNLIIIGQLLSIGSRLTSNDKKNASSVPIIDLFGLQSDTERTVYATWTYDKYNVGKFTVKWLYTTKDGVEFIGNESTVEDRQSLYTAPENAVYVSFYVCPGEKNETGATGMFYDPKKSQYGKWSTVVRYYFADNPPSVPPAPTVTIDGYKLTAKLDNLGINAKKVEFQVVKDNKSVFNKGSAKIETSHASYSCSINAGSEYKVRCRGVRDKLYSDWSEYSENVGTAPAASEGITSLRALSPTSVYISWSKVVNTDKYEIEYTTDKSYFDSSSETKKITIDAVANHAEITGLETGNQFFFRLRATNSQGESPWTSIKSIKIGTQPAAPTTWSSTTTAITGEPLNLYWTHNSEDESNQTKAVLELIVGNKTTTNIIWHGSCLDLANKAAKTVSISGFNITNNAIVKVEMRYANTADNPTLNVNATGAKPIVALGSNTSKWMAGAVVVFKYDGSKWNIIEDDADNNTTVFSIDTSSYVEGTKIMWRVKTMGIINVYSDWSIQRSIDIYAPPTLELSMTDVNGNMVEDLMSLPVYISGVAGPSTQKAIGYHVSIISNDVYETFDNMGNEMTVNKGTEVYSKYFDVDGPLLVELSAGDIRLDNNISYTVICTVSMNSGLTAESSLDFVVAWAGDEYYLDADVGYDGETYSTFIRPYCMNAYGVQVEDVMLSVYRREFDGSFTELATGLNNTEDTFITDPHPALDYARYRIVGIDKDTSKVSFYDLPGYYIGEKAVIIQWNEDWTNFDLTNDAPRAEPIWSGSLLRLPYNIDISDDHKLDVELVKYIGRKRPVTYYGTHLGETSTWSMEIDKTDKETLYALRRLAIWMGDVYVREPSGSGYWANVSVSFSQNHLELTIPVSLNITRVDGGV